MTPQEFHARHPDQDETNENALEDMACPGCGSRGRFAIAVTTTAIFDDLGSDDVGDLEYENDSSCTCRECGHAGTVADFTVDGLDAFLSALGEGNEGADSEVD
jgi:DNA-directed RNA polymerase subunit RPC12/RpoP